MTESAPVRTAAPPFVETKEYRRFAEFCDAVRRDRYIGLCYGLPGVGKTLSARHYACWDAIETIFNDRRFWMETPVRPDLAGCRTIVYTPSMITTPKRLTEEVQSLRGRFDLLVEAGLHPDDEEDREIPYPRGRWTELVLVDEADRLKFPTLEQLRDLYDRGQFGLVLIGMPGLEKRLARYAQFYSRVGFVHQFRPLSADELRFILEWKWRELGLGLDVTEFDDIEALTALIRITGGNFRLVQRLFAQIGRILEINNLRRVSKDVVEATRESLVIGTS